MHGPSGRVVLSQKHGVNPSVSNCFWCGEGKEVILFGRLPNDAEAPRSVVVNYDPCDKCKGQFQQGVLWVEALHDPLNDRQIKFGEGYPTGDFVVLTVDATKRILAKTPEVLEAVLKKGICCVEPDVFRPLFKDAPASKTPEIEVEVEASPADPTD